MQSDLIFKSVIHYCPKLLWFWCWQ